MSDSDPKTPTEYSGRVLRLLLKIFLRSIPIIPASALFYELITELKTSRNTIDQKIDEANESLRKTSSLIDEIEQILSERSQRLALLREEVARYSQLAEVEESRARPIVEQLERSVSKGKVQERWASFAINLIAGLILFFVGVFLSPYVNNLISGSDAGKETRPPDAQQGDLEVPLAPE